MNWQATPHFEASAVRDSPQSVHNPRARAGPISGAIMGGIWRVSGIVSLRSGQVSA
jgi:hypothetical protein